MIKEFLKKVLKWNNKAFPDPEYTKSLDPKWLIAIRERFGDREDIGRDRVYERYFAKEGLPREEVFDCFDLIETEFGYIGGLLRPDDSLGKLVEQLEEKNPFRSMTYNIMAGDRQLWLGEELMKQMRKHGTYAHRKSIRMETIGDFVMAWCGRIPGDPKSSEESLES